MNSTSCFQNIVENASNWNLEDDRALLRHLEALSKEIVSNAEKTHENLTGLLDNLAQTDIRLQLVTNNLQSLHDSQFIESRVRDDDDETVSERNELQEGKSKEQEEITAREDISEAIIQGVELLNTYYERVEVPTSDTEDENEITSYILRPKDPYLTRPLPYVIGTDDWYRHWHVGLHDSDTSDTDNHSDSDDVALQHSSSSSTVSSTVNVTGNNNTVNVNVKPNANSTSLYQNDTIMTTQQQQSHGEDDNDDDNSLPVHTPISSVNFAEELASKLGSVLSVVTTDDNDIVVNTRPIKKAAIVANTLSNNNLFFDEPPPLLAANDSDDSDDVTNNDMFSSGKFDGGRSLNNNTKTNTLSGLFSELEKERSQLFDGESSKIGKSFFDVSSDSDDELFKSKLSSVGKTKYLKPSNDVSTVAPLVDDEPPLLPQEKDATMKAPPPGGVSLFGGKIDIFSGSIIKNLTARQTSTSTSDSSVQSDIITKTAVVTEKLDSSNKKTVKTAEKIDKSDVVSTDKSDIDSDSKIMARKPEKLGLFDDSSSDLFEDDLFSNISTKKFTSGLFDDIPDIDDILKRRNNTVTSKSDSPTSKTDSIPSNTDKLTTDSLPTKSDNLPFKSDSLPSKSDSLLSNSDSLPSNSDSLPTTKDSLTSKTINTDTLSVVTSLFDIPPDFNDNHLTDESDNLLFNNDIVSFYDDNDNSQQMPQETSLKPSIFDSDEPPSLFHSSNDSNDILDGTIHRKLSIDNEVFSFDSKSEEVFDGKFDKLEEIDSKNKTDSTTVPIDSNLDLFDSTTVENVTATNVNVSATKNDSNLDLFDSSIVGNVTTTKSDNISLFEDVMTDSVDILGDKVSLFDSSVTPVTSDVTMGENKAESPPEMATKGNVEGRSNKMPGKLKHNLNINVSALLPGNKTPLLSLRTKQQQQQQPPDVTVMDTTDTRKGTVTLETEGVETLQSVTKDRVKIPIKRRPSTRKARQTMRNNTNSDYVVNSEEIISPSNNNNDCVDNISRDETTEKQQSKTNNNVPGPEETSQNYKRDEETFQSTEKSMETTQNSENVMETKQNKEKVIETKQSTEKVMETTQKQNTVTNIGKKPKKKVATLFDSTDSSDSDVDNLFGTVSRKNITPSALFGDDDLSLFKKPSKPDSTDSLTIGTDSYVNETMKTDSNVSETMKTNKPTEKTDSNDSLTIKTDISATSTSTLTVNSSVLLSTKPSVINSDSFESPDYKKSRLFFSNDENDDELFSTVKLPPKSAIIKKSSLFDDDSDNDSDDDDDDGRLSLFKSAKSKPMPAVVLSTKAPVRKLSKPSNLQPISQENVKHPLGEL